MEAHNLMGAVSCDGKIVFVIVSYRTIGAEPSPSGMKRERAEQTLVLKSCTCGVHPRTIDKAA
jgi:hypothetical protein